MQLADLARRNGAAARRDQTRLDPGNQRADGVVASRRPNDGDRRGTFGDAVAVAQRQPEFRFDFGFQRRVERRTGDAQPSKLAAGQPVDTSNCLILQQPLIRGRYAGH